MSYPLKALLLSAGYGKRLRPITNNKPKCLVEVNKEPMLGRWIKSLQKLGCKEILINTHYFADQVNKYIYDNFKNNNFIKVVYEKELKGTAGTLIENLKFFENSDGLIIHADNITNFDLSKLIEAHKNKASKCILTMLTFESRTPSKCGIVEIDKEGILTNFYEKIANPPSNRANGAVYVFGKEFKDFLINNQTNFFDISLDIVPKLFGKIQTFHTKDLFLDIGTPESLMFANKKFINIQDDI